MTITNQQGCSVFRHIRIHNQSKKQETQTSDVTNSFLLNLSRYEFQKELNINLGSRKKKKKKTLQPTFKVKPNGVDPSQPNNVHCSQYIIKQIRVPITFTRRGPKQNQD